LAADNVLAERVHHKIKKNKDRHRRSKSLIGSKLGPIEMGKIKDYKGTKLDYASENEFDDMLSEKTHVVIKKKWGLPKQINVGMEMEMDSDSTSEENNLYDSQSPINATNPNLRSINSAFASNKSSPRAVSFKRGKSMTPTSSKKRSKPTTPKTPKRAHKRRRSSTPGTPKRSRIKSPKKKNKKKKKKERKQRKQSEDVDDYKEERKKMQKKRKRKIKKKKNKKGNASPNVDQYKKKLRRHYENESDQEYVQNMKKSVDENEEKDVEQRVAPRLVQSTSSSLHVVDDNDDDVKKVEEQKEVVHIIHEIVDSSNSDGSDTDFSDNGSLNALSSSSGDGDDGDGDGDASRWI